MSDQKHLTSPAPAWAEERGAFRTFIFGALPVLIGLALAAGAHLWFIFPRLGAGSADLDRCVAIGEFVQKPLSDRPTVLFIGDSVTVEGIDSSIVASHAPEGWRVLNAGINGGDRLEQAVMVPTIAKCKPTMVVWVSRPMYLGAPPADLHPDRAAAYRIGDFADNWPAGWLTESTIGLSPELMETLTGPRVRAELHFRTSLIHAVDQRIKGVLRRGDYRAAGFSNWTDPYQMNMQISGERLEKHLNALRQEHAERVGRAKQPEEYERIIAHLAGAGIRPVMVLTPIHPEIRARGWFEPEAGEMKVLGAALAAKYNGMFIDASELLSAEDFADGQHPSKSGREKLSAFIGERLPAPAASPSGGGN